MKTNNNSEYRPLWMAEGTSTLTTPGWVYFIQGVSGGPIKIGWATDPIKRMAQMQSHCPVRLKLLHTEPGHGRQEKALHARFKGNRSHGEWFEASEDLSAYIRSRVATNDVVEYRPAIEKPVPENVLIVRPKRPTPPEPKADPEPPSDGYWDYGNPGWEKLKLAIRALE